MNFLRALRASVFSVSKEFSILVSYRPALLVAAVIFTSPILAAPPADPQPSTMDLCPVCGMLVAKYPNWVAVVVYKDGHAHFFDGAKDLFKFLPAPEKFAPGHRRDQIAAIQVTEYYGLTRIEARAAWYVIDSDVLGPMGHELIPLASEADAADFLREHHGKRVLSFDQVTPEIVLGLDQAASK